MPIPTVTIAADRPRRGADTGPEAGQMALFGLQPRPVGTPLLVVDEDTGAALAAFVESVQRCTIARTTPAPVLFLIGERGDGAATLAAWLGGRGRRWMS